MQLEENVNAGMTPAKNALTHDGECTGEFNLKTKNLLKWYVRHIK